MAIRKSLKLSVRFYGPYKVLAKVGAVAYKLELPPSSSVHPVFHVSLLKKKVEENVVPMIELPVFQEDMVEVVPKQVLQSRLISRNGQQVDQVLIKWKHLAVDDATWEDKAFLLNQFPEFAHSLGH